MIIVGAAGEGLNQSRTEEREERKIEEELQHVDVTCGHAKGEEEAGEDRPEHGQEEAFAQGTYVQTGPSISWHYMP